MIIFILSILPYNTVDDKSLKRYLTYIDFSRLFHMTLPQKKC